MPGHLLPLFPLGVVLFPRTPLPLHIFEERYKAMISEAIRDHSEFGVVLAAERGILNLGCTARVTEVIQRYEDGRLDIMTRGETRFELHRLNNERSFYRGEVTYFDDDIAADPEREMRASVISHFEKMFGKVTEVEAAIDLEDSQLSFQLAQLVQDLSLRQQLLSLRTEQARLALLDEQLPKFARRKEIADQMRTLAPRNGHGKHKPESD
jgi:Lon protease-like protein